MNMTTVMNSQTNINMVLYVDMNVDVDKDAYMATDIKQL
jgi:hypothetical protein